MILPNISHLRCGQFSIKTTTMFKKNLIVLISVLMSISSFAQMKINTSYEIPTKIIVDGKLIVNIFPSDNTDKLTVKTEITNAAFKVLSIEESDGNLVFSRKSPLSFKKQELDSIIINVYVAKPDNIEAMNKAEVYFGQNFSIEKFTVSSSNSATIAPIIKSKNVNITATNGGKVSISGSSDDVTIKANTNGYVNTVQLEAINLYATTATNSECYVKAKTLLDLKATTTSNIFYKGYATTVQKHTATFGNIEQF